MRITSSSSAGKLKGPTRTAPGGAEPWRLKGPCTSRSSRSEWRADEYDVDPDTVAAAIVRRWRVVQQGAVVATAPRRALAAAPALTRDGESRLEPGRPRRRSGRPPCPPRQRPPTSAPARRLRPPAGVRGRCRSTARSPRPRWRRARAHRRRAAPRPRRPPRPAGRRPAEPQRDAAAPRDVPGVGRQAVGEVDHRARPRRRQRAARVQPRLGAQVGADQVLAAPRATLEHRQPRARRRPAGRSLPRGRPAARRRGPPARPRSRPSPRP